MGVCVKCVYVVCVCCLNAALVVVHVTQEWVISHVEMSHVTQEWVMSHVEMSHVTHNSPKMNLSCDVIVCHPCCCMSLLNATSQIKTLHQNEMRLYLILMSYFDVSFWWSTLAVISHSCCCMSLLTSTSKIKMLHQNEMYQYGVATISRLLKITGLFCKRAL